jgi:dUTP pyrophosphatase
MQQQRQKPRLHNSLRTRALPVEYIDVELKRLRPSGRSVDLPSYATAGSAGMDLRACLESVEPLVLEPGERMAVPTGLAIALPEGTEAQIRPRSGLALKKGITCLNTPGTIDSDYRGELKVILANLGNERFEINHGDRIAQMVLAPYLRGDLKVVEELSDTNRGSGGFGSTGLT